MTPNDRGIAHEPSTFEDTTKGHAEWVAEVLDVARAICSLEGGLKAFLRDVANDPGQTSDKLVATLATHLNAGGEIHLVMNGPNPGTVKFVELDK